MTRFSPFLALLLCLPLAARADEASHKAKAEELVTVLHLDRAAAAVSENALSQTQAITSQHYGGKVPPAASENLADFQKKLKALLEPELGWEAVKPQFVKFVEDSFAEDQLDGILAFYKSPAGKALVEKMPTVQQEIQQLIQAKVQKLQPQVRTMFDDFQKNLPPAAGAGAAAPGAGAGASTPSDSTTPSTQKGPTR